MIFFNMDCLAPFSSQKAWVLPPCKPQDTPLIIFPSELVYEYKEIGKLLFNFGEVYGTGPLGGNKQLYILHET